MCEKQVDGILLVIIACILAAVLFGLTVQMQVVKDDCRMTLPKKEGKFCQKRDIKGNIYYVTKDGKKEAIK
jgi:hypothetical protein